MVQDKSVLFRLSRITIYSVMVICGVLTLFPLLHLAAISLSAPSAVAANRVLVWPIDFTVDSYQIIINEGRILQGFFVSVRRVLAGSLLNMLIIIITAYPLSFDNYEFKGRNIFMWFMIIPMLFSGGLIPTYLLIRNLGLLNSFWSMILPGLMPIFNVIMMMNFFRGIPKEMVEAAKIDGAGFLRILANIILPVSTASLATISLFCIVGHWNAWFDAMIYIRDFSKWPLQTILRNIVNQQNTVNIEALMAEGEWERILRYSDKTLSTAQIFISTIPILCVYPLLQRYFITGIVVGSVKG